jgi:hypothetical protein
MVNFNLEQATKAQTEIRGTDLLFFNLGARYGSVVKDRPL